MCKRGIPLRRWLKAARARPGGGFEFEVGKVEGMQGGILPGLLPRKRKRRLPALKSAVTVNFRPFLPVKGLGFGMRGNF